MADTDVQTAVIPAHSKRQVMDWSLVLASQEISSTIIQGDEKSWALLVEPGDYERARQAIRQYRAENRRWGWRQPIPWSGATFHWGAAGWCAWLILIHWLTMSHYRLFRETGPFDTTLFAQGEWWRAFTAILLHADVAHLLGNVTTGFLLFGLAMARFGPGLALLTAYFAGAAGNLAGFFLHARPYAGLGASGMVMGALGLVSVPVWRDWAKWHAPWRQLARTAFGSLLLFLLWGVNPKGDIVAHFGGYVAGLLLGTAVELIPEKARQDRALAAGCWILFVGLVLTTTWLAVR